MFFEIISHVAMLSFISLFLYQIPIWVNLSILNRNFFIIQLEITSIMSIDFIIYYRSLR